MNKFLCGLALSLTTLSAAPALAQEKPNGALPFGTADVMDAHALAAVTGRADVAMEIRAQNTSTVSNNSVSGESTTGQISFDSGAFQSLAGLSLLSANTGNNVSINSSLNVNISIQP